jgi:hypothetical protein
MYANACPMPASIPRMKRLGVHFPSSPRRFLLDPTRKKLFGLLRSGDKWLGYLQQQSPCQGTSALQVMEFK